MKRQIALVLCALAFLLFGAFKEGRRWERAVMSAGAAAPVDAVTSAAPPDELKACLDTRIAEQLNYVKWRGQHIHELANCAASLEEATHALVRRRAP
jgi:hypothetical protein